MPMPRPSRASQEVLNAVAAKRAVGDSGAYRVGIWLGCDTPGTKKAFTGDGPLPEVFLAVVGARLTHRSAPHVP